MIDLFTRERDRTYFELGQFEKRRRDGEGKSSVNYEH